MGWISDPQIWIGLGTLTALEIVLGIDNVVFLAILAAKLPLDQQKKARQVGLTLAMLIRIALLLSLSWMIKFSTPLFSILGHDFSGRDLILIGGGLFLLAKSTHEIHQKLEGDVGHASARVHPTFGSVIVQILLLDIVFSIDSIITAIGMVEQIGVMIAAVMIAVVFMMFFAGRISRFVERHPTVKMLALSFLILIGATLVAEGFHQHISKGYIYFAMAFSVFVEMLNLRLRKTKPDPVRLHQPYTPQ